MHRLRTIVLLAIIGILTSACTSMLLGSSGSMAPVSTNADAKLANEVSYGLRARGFEEASQVSVRAAAGRITLSGTVSTQSARQRAGAIAASISGVTTVANALRVGS